MVEFTLTLGPEELDALIELSMSHPLSRARLKKFRIASVVMAVIYAVVALFVLFGGWPFGGLVFGGLAGAMGFYAYYGAGWQQRRSLERAIARMDPAVREADRHYRVDNDGIVMESTAGGAHYDWNDFRTAGEYLHYWYLRAAGETVLFDKYQLDFVQRDQLEILLRSHIVWEEAAG